MVSSGAAEIVTADESADFGGEIAPVEPMDDGADADNADTLKETDPEKIYSLTKDENGDVYYHCEATDTWYVAMLPVCGSARCCARSC